MPDRPCFRSATARSTASTPKPVNPAAAAASIRSRRGTGLPWSSREGAASPAVVQQVASSSSAAVMARAPAAVAWGSEGRKLAGPGNCCARTSSIAPPGCRDRWSESAGVPLGLGGELDAQRVGRPVLVQCPPDEFGLGLGRGAADGLVAVEVGGKGVALGGGGDDVAECLLGGAAGFQP